MISSKQFLIACAIITSAGTSAASTGTSTGSGALPGFSGYGYEYVATWTATTGEYVFNRNVSYYLGPNGGIVFFDGRFNTPPGQSSYPYVEALDFVGSVTYSIVNLTSGLPELPPQMNYGSYTNRTSLGSTTGGLPVEFRFSNSQITQSFEVIDANGLPFSSAQPLTPTVTLTIEYQFRAGHFAMVSPDPSCASVSCMPVGYDRLVGIPAFQYVTSVPEPSGAALMLTGGALLAMTAFRRRSTRGVYPKN
jgi:hypothetical protein